MKKDYKAADRVKIVSLPNHIKRPDLIGKEGIVNLNDPTEKTTPLQVYIGGRNWEHLFHFDYDNVIPLSNDY